MGKQFYLMDEETHAALMKVGTGISCLEAAIPPAYLQTPYGHLSQVSLPVRLWAISAAPLHQCDYCEEIEAQLTRCNACDTPMCGGCYRTHRH